jgi:hypothetical protein
VADAARAALKPTAVCARAGYLLGGMAQSPPAPGYALKDLREALALLEPLASASPGNVS